MFMFARRCFFVFGFAFAVLLGGQAKAQSTTCAANEPVTNLNFTNAGNAWTAGSLTYSGTAGAVSVAGAAAGGNWVAGNPVSGVAMGGSTNVLTLTVDRPNATVTNTVTFTFSQPVNNLRLRIHDIDYYRNSNIGAYNDQVTVSGTSILGVTVVPTGASLTTSGLVDIVGNTAYAGVNANASTNCATTSINCSVRYDFAAPITSLMISYENTTDNNWAFGDPPAQAIGLEFAGFCTQNGQALNLAKTWVEATAGHTASATTSSNRVTNASLAAANATFTSTATTNTTGTAVQVYPGETITLTAETFGGGATQAMYASTLQCTGGTPLASGSTNRTITIGSTSNAATTCAYTNRGLLTDVSVVKTRTPTGNVAPGNTITYTLTVTNNGPATTTGTNVTDTPNAALSCPTATSGPATLTCTGSGCPAAPLYVSTLTGAGIVMGTQTAGQSAQLQFSCTVQ